MTDSPSSQAPPSKRAKTNKDDDDNVAMTDEADDDPKTKALVYTCLPGYGEHKRAVSSVKFCPTKLTNTSGALCASSAADGLLKLWNVREAYNSSSSNTSDEAVALDAKLTMTGHQRGINEICWNPVTPLLASASDDKTIRLWDAVTGDTLVEYRGHDNFVFCVDQHEHTVVSGSFDETVKIWDVSWMHACCVCVCVSLCVLECRVARQAPVRTKYSYQTRHSPKPSGSSLLCLYRSTRFVRVNVSPLCRRTATP
jgi:WD40 repeat protein